METYMFRSLILAVAIFSNVIPASAEVIGIVTTPTASTSSVPEGCKIVTVSRPDVTKPTFEITFKNVDLGSMQKCWKDSRSTPNGIAVLVTVKKADLATGGIGSAKIVVPVDIKEGNVHNARCVNNGNGEVIDAVLYKATWSGDQTPDTLPLTTVGRDFYDVAALKQSCQVHNVARELR
jgi:hypothetical protein